MLNTFGVSAFNLLCNFLFQDEADSQKLAEEQEEERRCAEEERRRAEEERRRVEEEERELEEERYVKGAKGNSILVHYYII